MAGKKFKPGDIVEYLGTGHCSCEKGCQARVYLRTLKDFPDSIADYDTWVWLKWLEPEETGLRHGQQDGAYQEKLFQLVSQIIVNDIAPEYAEGLANIIRDLKGG